MVMLRIRDRAASDADEGTDYEHRTNVTMHGG